MFAISKEYVCVCCYGKRLNVGNVGSFQLLRERAYPFWCESSRIDSCEYFRWDGEKVVLYPIFCARSIILRKSITIYIGYVGCRTQFPNITYHIFILEIWSFDLMAVIFGFLAYVSWAFHIYVHAMHCEFRVLHLIYQTLEFLCLDI